MNQNNYQRDKSQYYKWESVRHSNICSTNELSVRQCICLYNQIQIYTIYKQLESVRQICFVSREWAVAAEHFRSNIHSHGNSNFSDWWSDAEVKLFNRNLA